ncbi:MAG: LuxR family transcriptional regulator [Paracoccaceae bacterium]
MRGASEFALLSPTGYYMALRIGFAFPLVEHNVLPKEWVDHYTRENYMLADPVMRWLYSNSGHVRWSEIKIPDPRGVMKAAARFGLNFGVAVSLDDPGPKGQRSFGSFTRADREFTDSEIAVLTGKLWRLHVALAPPTNLTEAELQALRMVKEGLLIKEIAARLGVSEGAVKQRIKSAKLKLGAKTSSQAVSAATGYGLI